MVVITLEKCPLALRGDLTRWLQEISLGVYVGQVSARVRDKLWLRVCEECKSGRATMVYSSRCEQHLSFEVHNAQWEPIDFDGMKLMLRPSAERTASHNDSSQIHSNAALNRNKSKTRERTIHEPEEYVVIALATTIQDSGKDEINEIAALKVILGEIIDTYHVIVCEEFISDNITNKENINNSYNQKTKTLYESLDGLLDFIENLPLIMHNSEYNLALLDEASAETGLEEIENEIVDTLELARKKHPTLKNTRIDSFIDYYGMARTERNGVISECHMIRDIFIKLLSE